MCLQDPERKPSLIFEPMQVERLIQKYDNKMRDANHSLSPLLRYQDRFEECMDYMNTKAQKIGVLCKKDVETIFDCELIFLQNINENHWILHYMNKQNMLTQCDPLMSSNNSFTRFNTFIVAMINYIRTGNETSRSSCQQVMPINLPQQNNSYDCRLFTIIFLECIICKAPLQFYPIRMRYVCEKL